MARASVLPSRAFGSLDLAEDGIAAPVTDASMLPLGAA